MTEPLPPISEDVSLAPFSTLKVGGPARFLARVQTTEQLKALAEWARSRAIHTLMLGRGSNCLFDDRGFSGLVFINEMQNIEWGANDVVASSGVSLAQLSAQSAKRELGGLEFACGIPGTVGGGIFMNAGAHGKDLAQCLMSVEWLDERGELRSSTRRELEFGYRSSPFQHTRALITRATFALNDDEGALARCQGWMRQRAESQPTRSPSVGCIFRNPPSKAAGALIEEMGFKGQRVGDAQISPIHANYIINLGHATSGDVWRLISQVREAVWRAHRLQLELEVRVIPWGDSAAQVRRASEHSHR